MNITQSMNEQNEQNRTEPDSRESSAIQARDKDGPTPIVVSIHRIVVQHLENSTLLGLRSFGERSLMWFEWYECSLKEMGTGNYWICVACKRNNGIIDNANH